MATNVGGRRGQVLSTAARLFSDRGYHGTSMQHLAERLGILRGSIYAHISSKQDLLFEIVDAGADRFIAGMREVTSSEADARTKLRRAIEAHVLTVVEQMDAATVFLNDWRFLTGPRRKTIQRKRDEYEGLVRGIIADGVAQGAFRRDLDPKLAAMLVLSAVNWLYQWYDPKGPGSAQDIAAAFGEMIVSGFEPRPPTRRSR